MEEREIVGEGGEGRRREGAEEAFIIAKGTMSAARLRSDLRSGRQAVSPARNDVVCSCKPDDHRERYKS